MELVRRCSGRGGSVPRAFLIGLCAVCRWIVKGGFEDCTIASSAAELKAMARETTSPERRSPIILPYSFLPWPVEPDGANVLTINLQQIRQRLAGERPPSPAPVSAEEAAQASAPTQKFLRKERLAKQPVIVEFFAGEAGMSAEFFNLGWSCIVHEREIDAPWWGPKLPENKVKFWRENLINVSRIRNQLLACLQTKAFCLITSRSAAPPCVAAHTGAAHRGDGLRVVCQ